MGDSSFDANPMACDTFPQAAWQSIAVKGTERGSERESSLPARAIDHSPNR